MRTLLIVSFLVVAAHAVAQNCVVPAPSVPPVPTELRVILPTDGGTVGCVVQAYVPNGQPPARYPIGNTACAQSRNIARQAAAKDNGWDDGGSP